jgi:hypothetical protein
MRPDGRDESMSDTIDGLVVDMLSRPHIFHVAYVRPQGWGHQIAAVKQSKFVSIKMLETSEPRVKCLAPY